MPSVHRFWDLIESADVTFYSDITQDLPKRMNKTRDLIDAISPDSERFSFESRLYGLPLFVRVFAAICRRSQFNTRARVFWLSLSYVVLPFFILASRIIKPKICVDSFDILWCGGNNFDRSNVILLWFKYSGKLLPLSNVVRSYKESSGQFSLDEWLMLQQSIAYIFPSQDYLKFYTDIYGEKVLASAGSIRFMDEDVRYSKLKKFISSLEVEKVPNSVVILTGRLLLESVTPSDERYIYYDYCIDLVKSGYQVFIHTPKSTKSVLEAYRAIEGVSVLNPLDLESSIEDYRILSRYEFGVMHNPRVKEKLSSFTLINVPNRYYEYEMCNVQPFDFKRFNAASFSDFTRVLLDIVD